LNPTERKRYALWKQHPTRAKEVLLRWILLNKKKLQAAVEKPPTLRAQPMSLLQRRLEEQEEKGA
jgi:hypothetical protein